MPISWNDYLPLAKTSKVLVVGAGGIGCELLKNLVLSGFHDITVIDLDTIDVTNLNRQFLFHKQHVGKSKSMVARESALSFNPDAKIEALHDSIMKPDYGVQFFKQFKMVMNALDNRAARSHVNRMCLAADIPLVESGTAGYLGQVTVIRKKQTECYECTPKPHQKTFPGCTIRNTPSEPIHCIVWSKHLFNQLFGETDPDEEVSPDTEDPEAEMEKKGEAAKNDGNVTRISTRQWAQDNQYDAKILFNKFFFDDINYLLTMDKLWSKRTPPKPLKWGEFSSEDKDIPQKCSDLKDQVVWNMSTCAKVFEDSINELKDNLKKLPENDHLVWDKDDEAAMNFVASCANIRSHVFHIPTKSKFDIKSMAGNIIPAIATTNAIIAGAIVMEGIKLLCEDHDRLRSTFVVRKPNPRRQVLVPMMLSAPNPKCYVCTSKHEVSIKLNLNKMTLKHFEDNILKGTLSMVAPDVEVDGKGVILISSEEGETEGNMDKVLSDFNLADGTILSCDDFLQEFSMKIYLFHSDKMTDASEFELLSDVSNITASTSSKETETKNGSAEEHANGNGDKSENGAERKRKPDDVEDVSAVPTKKLKPNPEVEEQKSEDIICLE